MKTRRRRESGFTIIEVMVVVGIMTILAIIAVPNLTSAFRRSALRAEGRRLYGAFVEAQGLAASESVPFCLHLDRINKRWEVRRNANDDGSCDTGDTAVTSHGRGSDDEDEWPSHIAFGPDGGISTSLPVPYDGVPVDAWCSECGGTDGAVFFDIDGRIVDSNGDVIDSGAIMMHDSTGESDGLVEVVMFIGPTGNVRLFSMTE